MSENFLERVNFFNGLFTEADDWNKAHNYHIEKSKFHNRYLHTPGIAFNGDKDVGLMVTTSSSGTAINVSPGYAIDGEGNALYLPKRDKPYQIKLDLSLFHLPTTLYVSIKHNEEKTNERKIWDAADPNKMEFASIIEEPIVEITEEAPDNYYTIELARIKLSAEATRITDDDIDLTERKKAGSEAKLEKVTLADLGEKKYDNRQNAFAKKETEIPISESITEGDRHRFYLVSVYPEKEADIRWCIESRHSHEGAIQYMLIIDNRSGKNVPINYRVYRLH